MVDARSVRRGLARRIGDAADRVREINEASL
jgi:hypothetical protein